MELGRKSIPTLVLTSILLVLVGVFCGACSHNGSMSPTTAPRQGTLRASASATDPAAPIQASSTNGAPVEASSTNGSASQMPAFYDDKLFTVNMKQMPDLGSASTIAHNGSINEIYASNDLDEEQTFTPVLDAIQGDGFNPLWQQNLIVFNTGFTPHQFTSDTDVLAAASGSNPEITIVTTDEVYRCSVVGTKK